jgi:hypothetical protein
LRNAQRLKHKVNGKKMLPCFTNISAEILLYISGYGFYVMCHILAHFCQVLHSLFLSKIICTNAALLWRQKVGEKATWCQFHQHFIHSFCAKIFSPKNYNPKL